MAYGFGTLDTLEQLGGGTVDRVFLGATTTFTNTDDSLSMGTTVTWQAFLLYAAVFTVPFLLGARVWRAWARTTPSVAA